MSFFLALILLIAFVAVGMWIVSLLPAFGPPVLKTLLQVFILVIALFWLVNILQGSGVGFPSLR